jgi:hypothetical protein
VASDYERIRTDNLKEYGEGTRHLAFLGRLYSDRTHFVFELLQNAEDAEATQVLFKLYHDRLEVWHDGRPFNEKDVRGICGVGEGTKADDLTQIGKFGIGFKSVYAYTARPEIHSGEEHFHIEHYVRPYAIAARELGTAWTTLFVFPFNHAEVKPNQAFQEIGNRLRSLDTRTLLFLRNISEIEWTIEEGPKGVYRRKVEEGGAARRVSVAGQNKDRKDEEAWLVFERPARLPDDSAFVRVEAAFRLVKDEKTDQDSIVRTDDSPLVVFFPTEKPTSLGFLIQGPYRTTPARDNIPKDNEWNKQLIQETATLITEALAQLRDMGLLTVSLLETMPIRPSDFPTDSMFRPLFDHVRDALRGQPLLPTDNGGFVSAKHAKLARGMELLDLFSPSQLGDLLGATEPVQWLSREISENRTPDLYRYLVGRTARWKGDSEASEALANDLEVRPEVIVRKLTSDFMAKQEDTWITRLYTFLGRQRDLWTVLRDKPFLRLQDGSHVPPFRSNGSPNAYLPPPDDTDYPIVKREIVVNEQAREFLKHLGLSTPDIVDDVMEKVLPKYKNKGMSVDALSDDEHKRDIQKIFRALQTDSRDKRQRLINRLKETPFLRSVNADSDKKSFQQPEKVYVCSSKLRLFLGGNPNAWLLDEVYSNEEQSTLCRVGVASTIRIRCRTPTDNGDIIVTTSHGWHKRGINGFDPDCEIEGLEHALKHINREKAVYIWNELLIPNRQHIRGVVESSSRQTFEGAKRQEQWSKMGKLVSDSTWLPDPDQAGLFHKPAELSLTDLPNEFRRDETLASLLKMKPAALDNLAWEYGVKPDLLRFALEHPEEIEALRRTHKEQKAEDGNGNRTRDKEPVDYGKELKAAFTKPGTTTERESPLPPGLISNPEQRRERTQQEIQQAKLDEPQPELRFQKVPRKIWEAKNNEARIFLLEQYAGQCQICGDTFQKRDGKPYFEGLYLVSRTHAQWIDRPGNVLCLCATCCAKFQYGSIEADDILEQVQTFRTHNEGGSGDPALCMRLCGKDVKVNFTEQHLLDLQELLKAAANDAAS